MATFQYSALRNDGERISGTMEGSDRAIVIGRLGEQGLHPIDVNVARPNFSVGRIWSLGGGGISSRELSVFTNELAWLLRAGTSLNNALAILTKEAFSTNFSRLVGSLGTEIRKGRTFHDALASSEVFSPYYVTMVEVGETSGTLASVLEQISLWRNRERKIRSRLLSALTYPLLLVTFATGAIAFIMTSVVPSIKDMILNSGAPVPAAAKFVIDLSDWLIANGTGILIALPVTALLVVFLLGARRLGQLLTTIAMHLPLLGSLLRKGAVLQFCRILGTLLAAGVNLPESLKLMRQSSANRQIAAALSEMEEALRRGEDFLGPLERKRIFPKLLVRMLKVGNETGNLTPSIVQVAEILEEELDSSIDRALTLLEPAIILVLSGVVAFIITSLMSAIISINDLAL